MRYELNGIKTNMGCRCEINTEDGYKIRMMGENIVQEENGFYLVVFDKKLSMVVDTINISAGQIVHVQE